MTLFTDLVQPYAAEAGALLVVIMSVGIMIQDHDARKRQAEGRLPETWRHDSYFRTIRQLWLMAALALLAWALSGNSLAEIGLTLGSGWRMAASWIIVGLILALMVLDFMRLVFGRAYREQAFAQFEKAPELDLIRPRTIREGRAFQGVAITAGITEEIVYRGFMIAALGSVIPVWAAAIAAGALFVALHAYQGGLGMLKVTGITLVLTGLYLLGGSLFPVIVLHIGVDLLAGGAFILMLKSRGTAQATT
ncbi:CPBP family intramembrane glutamic endopeptidase [Hyphobacterium sp.]|uniref:CPBP family intramembrane glutamic endopeptidase n=1 Tax=Hyphobacterium sp. TaxID=2004662 RepID=UPI003B52D65C